MHLDTMQRCKGMPWVQKDIWVWMAVYAQVGEEGVTLGALWQRRLLFCLLDLSSQRDADPRTQWLLPRQLCLLLGRPPLEGAHLVKQLARAPQGLHVIRRSLLSSRGQLGLSLDGRLWIA